MLLRTQQPTCYFCSCRLITLPCVLCFVHFFFTLVYAVYQCCLFVVYSYRHPFFLRSAIPGLLLVITTIVNLAVGVILIAADFFVEAIPDTLDGGIDKQRTKMARKHVVAPFINDTTIPVESCTDEATNEGTVLDADVDSSTVACRPGIEYLKLVTLGCGVTMDSFVGALKEDARVRHQIVHSNDDLVRLLSSGMQTDEGLAVALLSDLQERLGERKYNEHDLLEIAVCQKSKQQAAVVPREPSFPIVADASPPCGHTKSTAKRVEI